MWTLCDNCRFRENCGSEKIGKQTCNGFEFERCSILKDEDYTYTGPVPTDGSDLVRWDGDIL